jgi:2-haloacid dehalogenase
MADQSVRAVIFDLGGVLIDWNPRLILQEHFATHGVMEAFMADVFWQAHKACHDSDAPFEQTLAVWRDSHPHYTDALDAMAHHWDRAIMGPIPETVSVLDALVARNVPVFALTNWPAQTWPPRMTEGMTPSGADDVFGFLGHFRDIVVSGQEKLAKPDPAIYRLAMKRFGVGPGEALFVDDLAANARAAGEAGLVGHQFLSAGHLQGHLERLGLL